MVQISSGQLWNIPNHLVLWILSGFNEFSHLEKTQLICLLFQKFNVDAKAKLNKDTGLIEFEITKFELTEFELTRFELTRFELTELELTRVWINWVWINQVWINWVWINQVWINWVWINWGLN